MGDNNKERIDYVQHWNSKYENSEESKLGWYETDLSPMLKLLQKSNTSCDQTILLAGAGSTRLADALIELDYSSIVATDLSESALDELKQRLGEENIEYIVDDLTNATQLSKIQKVDLWIDRAVLHFFHNENEIKAYFDLLKSTLNKNGHVILAEFNTDGAIICSGLPVLRYDIEMLKEGLGSDFELIDHFNYAYINPGGAERPYIYSLFKRIN